MARVPPAPIDGPEADAAAVERIAQLRDGRITPLYRTLLHSGPVAAGWCELGTAIRWSSSLDDRLRELLTCQTARRASADYEWQAHAPLAAAAGVTAAQLDSLPAWWGEPSFDARDRAALAFTDAVLDSTVTDESFEATAQHFTRRETVEIAATVSYYLSISRFLAACDVH